LFRTIRAKETIKFSLDGMSYEIDLSKKNAEAAGRSEAVRRGRRKARLMTDSDDWREV